ncbi:hypothetical protein D3C81_1797660 [compost metagenome]
MGVFQKKRMTGLFNQTNFNIGQQAQQLARSLGRHQAIEAGKQMQLRPAESLQGLAGVQLGEQFQATHQHRWRRMGGTAQQQPRQAARVFGALGAEQAEAFEGGARVGVATGQEPVERLRRHGAGPLGMGDKRWIARQRQQATAALATAGGQFCSEHPAQ